MNYSERSTVQVCQLHGDPDDLVVCPDSLCQAGRIPQWWGNGMPAGTRRCEICEGDGRMRREPAELARFTITPHRRSSPPCICYRIREVHG